MKTIRLAAFAAMLIGMMATASTSRAGIIEYDAVLNGPSESPPNASPGTGFAEVDVDTTANTMRVQVSFSGLLGTTTASHIHSATAVPFTGTTGVATTTPTFTGFPLGVTSGTYDHTFDMTLGSSYNPAFITANGGTPASAEAALLPTFNNGTAYLNIHTTVVPGGEIRGFLIPVPEPSTCVLFGLGAMIAGVFRAIKRREKYV